MHDDAHRIAWAHYEGEECSRNSVDEMEVQINAAICDAVNKAIATERERCAKIAEQIDAGSRIADEIRAAGK